MPTAPQSHDSQLWERGGKQMSLKVHFWFQWNIVLDGVPGPQGKERFGAQTPSQNMQLQIAAKLWVLCCHLVNANEEFGGLATEIPLFAKLLLSLLLLHNIVEQFISLPISCHKGTHPSMPHGWLPHRWHPTADQTMQQSGATEILILIEYLYKFNAFGAQKLLLEFSDNGWNVRSLSRLFKKLRDSRSTTKMNWVDVSVCIQMSC